MRQVSAILEKTLAELSYVSNKMYQTLSTPRYLPSTQLKNTQFLCEMLHRASDRGTESPLKYSVIICRHISCFHNCSINNYCFIGKSALAESAVKFVPWRGMVSLFGIIFRSNANMEPYEAHTHAVHDHTQYISSHIHNVCVYRTYRRASA